MWVHTWGHTPIDLDHFLGSTLTSQCSHPQAALWLFSRTTQHQATRGTNGSISQLQSVTHKNCTLTCIIPRGERLVSENFTRFNCVRVAAPPLELLLILKSKQFNTECCRTRSDLVPIGCTGSAISVVFSFTFRFFTKRQSEATRPNYYSMVKDTFDSFQHQEGGIEQKTTCKAYGAQFWKVRTPNKICFWKKTILCSEENPKKPTKMQLLSVSGGVHMTWFVWHTFNARYFMSFHNLSSQMGSPVPW